MDALRASAPRHPGGYHYAIHAYDHPALAEIGLDVARGYDSIAPEVPHGRALSGRSGPSKLGRCYLKGEHAATDLMTAGSAKWQLY